MSFDLILAVIVISYLRKFIQTQAQLPKWDNLLKYLLFACIALMIISLFFNKSQPVVKWISHLPLLYLMAVLFFKKEFSKAKPMLLAVAPFAVLSLFSDIARQIASNQYNVWKNIIDTALVFSLIWMVIMWIVTNKQRKALENERIKTKLEEEQKKQIEVMKGQLEVQVAQRTAELTLQKEELQHTLEELKSTQAQLIHSEKMASLGELTAGIAHEIQNPLNFVNNFSEVSTELLKEMVDEINKGNHQEVKSIANDLVGNLEKINFHGKRADAIVKGMLQHSRTSTGKKEPADINHLCDEYLRLAFHGLRAKDKTFNAKFETEFDPNAGKINMVAQEIGRVILNLINNAFYSVNEKKKLNLTGYEPIVTVSTKRLKDADGNDLVEIRVRDNGKGIPKDIIDKIFQPFFTTKPTGQGTGLGLSLSYDIVTKEHQGKIRVESKEGEWTEFIVQLPEN